MRKDLTLTGSTVKRCPEPGSKKMFHSLQQKLLSFTILNWLKSKTLLLKQNKGLSSFTLEIYPALTNIFDGIGFFSFAMVAKMF